MLLYIIFQIVLYIAKLSFDNLKKINIFYTMNDSSLIHYSLHRVHRLVGFYFMYD